VSFKDCKQLGQQAMAPYFNVDIDSVKEVIVCSLGYSNQLTSERPKVVGLDLVAQLQKRFGDPRLHHCKLTRRNDTKGETFGVYQVGAYAGLGAYPYNLDKNSRVVMENCA